MLDRRLLVCVALSLLVHYAAGRGLDQLPPVPPPLAHRLVEVRLIEPPPHLEPPPPPPPPPPPVEPPPPPPPPTTHRPPLSARPAAHPVTTTTTPVEPAPVTSHVASTVTTARPDANPDAVPHFGVSMASTSTAGRGPALPVGNTTQAAPGGGGPSGPAGVPAPPAPAYQVTRMPLPEGRCSGAYTAEARAAGVEGVVVLDLVVDEHGRARDITVVTGLDHGLTDAAIAALRACHFTPGEKGGQPVAVKIRGFKIRFRLQDPG